VRVADIPERLTLRRNRDLTGRRHEIWVRRSLVALIVALVLAGLFNAFGQRPTTTSAAAAAAKLSVYAPPRVRSGLYYEARFHITASDEIKQAILVLGSGWLEGITINTIEPSPVGEASDNGRLSLTLGHVPAGKSYLLFMQSQVNPTNVGHRSQDVWLYDGKTLLTTIHRKITIFP
jgi:hypothetical protein